MELTNGKVDVILLFERKNKMLTEIKFKEPLDISEEDAKLYLAIKLFEEQKVSLAKASEIADYKVATFIELLSRKKIPVVNYPAEELREDILNA